MKQDIQIEDRVKKIISETLKIKLDLINLNSSMKNISQWDSLGHLNITLAMEKELKIQIPLEDLAKISSVKDWISIFKKYKNV